MQISGSTWENTWTGALLHKLCECSKGPPGYEDVSTKHLSCLRANPDVT